MLAANVAALSMLHMGICPKSVAVTMASSLMQVSHSATVAMHAALGLLLHIVVAGLEMHWV